MSKNKIKQNDITAEEFDKKFEAGEDVSEFFDETQAEMVYPKTFKVLVEFPGWMVSKLDAEANRIGVTRQSVIKTWIANCIDSLVPRAMRSMETPLKKHYSSKKAHKKKAA